MARWIKRTLIGLFGATALLGGIAAWAHNHDGGWRAMSEQDSAALRGRMVDKVAARLELDATQKARLGVLADALSAQRKALVGTTTDPRAEMQSLIAGPAFDRSKALALVQAKVNAMTVGAPTVVSAMGDFYDSLRPDQQAKVRDFMAKRGSRHRG